MREIRPLGSVRGVPGNRHSYRDKEAIGSELHTAQVYLLRLHGWVSVPNSAKPDSWSDPWGERG